MFHAICSSKLQLQMVMLSCSKGSGHWEKPTCTAQTGLSLEAGVSLEGSQGLIAPMYVKDDSTLDWVRKLRPYLLESFCPVFYNTMYFAIHLPEAIFSSFFCQLLSCLFSAHILQRYFWVETPDVQSCQMGQACLSRVLWEIQTQLMQFVGKTKLAVW